MQKKVAIIRLLKDSSAEVNSEFSRKEFFRPLQEWRTYARQSSFPIPRFKLHY